MKNILFLIQGENMPSSRVRVLNLLEKLRGKGYKIELLKYPKSKEDKLAMFGSLKYYDVVYLQKKLPSLIDIFFIRKNSNKLIYDFDDAVYMKHEMYKKQSSLSSRLKFSRIIKNSDMVVAGNRVLKEKAEEYNKNIEIVPSVIEMDGMPEKDYSAENDKFTVGWVGGNINISQLEMLSDVFRRLSEKIPMRLSVISGQAPDIKGVDMRFIPWKLETQDTEIANFDAGVMPLPDSPHARGKCGYKALQYMAAGVPPVVSDVGVNADIVQNGECGLVAENLDDFYDKILFLYENREKRIQMGKAARKRVNEHFSTDSAVQRLDSILRNL